MLLCEKLLAGWKGATELVSKLREPGGAADSSAVETPDTDAER